MVVMGAYVPNTPTLVEVPEREELGFPAHPATVAALGALGRRADALGVDAVVVVTPHFMARGGIPLVGSGHPRQLFDLTGFPESFQTIRYQPEGLPDLASTVVRAAERDGIPAGLTEAWGLDHGAWVPLRLIWPTAPHPVLPVGLGQDVSDQDHQQLGAVIARESGARRLAVVATGSLYHRLDRWGAGPMPPLAAALQFVQSAVQAWQDSDWDALWGASPAARQAAAPEGGLAGLRILAGAVGPRFAAEILAQELEFGAVSLTSVMLTPQ